LIWLFISPDRDHFANIEPGRFAMVAVDRSQITADERVNEIAEILAVGLMRVRARQSSALSPHGRESSLDCLGHQSGHADILKLDGGEV
jgi:hypothetical protein